MRDFSQFDTKAADWRAQLRVNQRKTKFVIGTYILLYSSIGLIIDFLIFSELYQNLGFSQFMNAMVNGYYMPYASLSMLGVAVVSTFIAFLLHDKIMMMGTQYHEVTSDSTDLDEKQLFNIVEELKIAAGMNYMPKIYIIEAEYMNAFASGYSEKSSVMAITRGLLNKLTRQEIQAVMAHELSHIRHLDIKVTLVVTLLSNIMLIVIDLLFYNIIYGRRGRANNWIFLVIILLRYLLPILTWILFLYLSRTREYMADAGSCQLTRGNKALASALIKIHEDYGNNHDAYTAKYKQSANEEVRRNAYIYDPVRDGASFSNSIDGIFSTHPKLENRLKAIGVYKTKP